MIIIHLESRSILDLLAVVKIDIHKKLRLYYRHYLAVMQDGVCFAGVVSLGLLGS